MHAPFRQWVMEDRFPQGRPAFEKVGVELVADVTPHEAMKLRMLNGTHSALAYVGYLAGHRTVAEAVADPVMADYLRHLWRLEFMPTVTAPEGTDLAAYADALMRRYAIRTICYNFMPVLDWTRTDLAAPVATGGTCLRFSAHPMAAFEIHMLGRDAARYNVSRQPVREAFGRLGNRGFLLVRPQKATEVQKCSVTAIATARFVRASVEVEIARRALDLWTAAKADPFLRNLAAQEAAVQAFDVDAFHELDYYFYRQMCIAAEAPFVFQSIVEAKAQVDRLCVTSMMQVGEMAGLVADRKTIFTRLSEGRDADLEAALLRHLSRLDETIGQVRAAHSDFFE